MNNSGETKLRNLACRVGKAPEVPEEECALSGTSLGSLCALETRWEVNSSVVWPPSLTPAVVHCLHVQVCSTWLSQLCLTFVT